MTRKEIDKRSYLLDKYKEGEETRLALPIQDEERCGISLMFRDYHKNVNARKNLYKMKKTYRVQIDGKKYKWGFGDYNYDGEYNYRLLIFDEDGRKIYNDEPVYLDEYVKDDIKEIIGSLKIEKDDDL